MGQYYKAVNLDKKQCITPHVFGDGAKLMEFACNGSAMLAGLAILLADGNGRGGGDLHSDNPIIGSWAGDRVVIAGDYADPDKYGVRGVLYEAGYEDISEHVIHALLDDSYVLDSWAKNDDHGWHIGILKAQAPSVAERLQTESEVIPNGKRNSKTGHARILGGVPRSNGNNRE